MTVRFHLFPFRTQKLSLLVPKIVSWKRLVKIGSRRLLYGPLVKRLRQRPLTPLTSVRFRYGSPYAPLAQLVEQLTLNQWAQGSSPWRCTTTTKSELFSNRRRVRVFCFLRKAECRGCAAMKAPVGLLSGRAVLRKQDGGALPRQAPAPSLTAVCPKPYQKKDRITKVTTVRVP